MSDFLRLRCCDVFKVMQAHIRTTMQVNPKCTWTKAPTLASLSHLWCMQARFVIDGSYCLSHLLLCSADKAAPALMDAAGSGEKPVPAEEQFREECDISKCQLLFEWLNNMCFTHSYSAPFHLQSVSAPACCIHACAFF